MDSRHALYMNNLPNEYKCDILVAVGENMFGAFLSAGYVRSSDMTSGSMMLGRRYLEEKDERATWSVEDLYKRIEAADRGERPLFGANDLWTANSKCIIPPSDKIKSLWYIKLLAFDSL
jgi:hypothetical protein